MSTDRECGLPECPRPVSVRGYCHAHYQRWRLQGGPVAPHVPVRSRVSREGTVEERIFRQLEETAEGCWEWRGHQGPNGYGQLGGDGTTYRVHRLVYVMLVGPVPDGLVLDHLCRNRLCANPAHLEPVPEFVNFVRGASPSAVAFRTDTCKRGHSLDLEIGDVYVTPTGKRDCRRCNRIRRAAA